MSRKGGLGKFLGGIAIGAGLGILLAPDIGEVKDELLFKANELKDELSNLDKEKAKDMVLDKAKEIRAKAEELYAAAIEKGTPLVEKAADEVRKQALKVVKDAEKKLKEAGKE